MSELALTEQPMDATEALQVNPVEQVAVQMGKITVLEALAEDVDVNNLDMYTSRTTTPISTTAEAEDD